MKYHLIFQGTISHRKETRLIHKKFDFSKVHLRPSQLFYSMFVVSLHQLSDTKILRNNITMSDKNDFVKSFNLQNINFNRKTSYT